MGNHDWKDNIYLGCVTTILAITFLT
ncbi:hypothetical protein EMIT0210MI2_250007 [Priestia megaterium]